MQITPLNYVFETQVVRVQRDEHDEPWFNARDVCAALELTNPSKAVADHVDPEDLTKRDTLTAGGVQRQNHINESGLYSLIMGSTKPSAKRFKRWVTSEVLPSIRKTGAYGAAPEQQATTATLHYQDGMRLEVPMTDPQVRSAVLGAIGSLRPVGHQAGEDANAVVHPPYPAGYPDQIQGAPTAALADWLGMTTANMQRLLSDMGLLERDEGRWLPTMRGMELVDTRPGSRRPYNSNIRWKADLLKLLQDAVRPEMTTRQPRPINMPRSLALQIGIAHTT